jgi:RNA ligase-like protein
MPEFKEFGKLYRLNRSWVCTEKIDGSNGCVAIDEDGVTITAQSRNRIVTPEADNAGFAKWVQVNYKDLLKLGPGFHYGEWMGSGIQRGYGLKEKRFYLFNSFRWATPESRPACCHVVPVLATGTDVKDVEKRALDALANGSVAVPEYTGKPEGIVLFHEPSHHLYKVTLEGDGHKSVKEAA